MVGQAVNTLNQVSANWLYTSDNVASDLGRSGWSALWATILVLALIVVGLWLFRWVVSRGQRENGGGIKILHRFYVSPKVLLLMVEVENRRLLLGVGDGGVSLICELERNNKFNQVMQEINRERGEQEDLVKELETQVEELKSAIRKRING